MIIGISSKLGCGKTTLTNMFLEKHPEYIRLGFADILKEECSKMYDYPLEWNYSEVGKSCIVNYSNLVLNHSNLPKPYMTVREVLQWHGTDYRRKQDPDYFAKCMKKIILSTKSLGIIIDDVRFKNEAELIKSYGGVLIRINPYLGWKPGSFAYHQSEIDLDNYNRFDLVLDPEFGQLIFCLPLVEDSVSSYLFERTNK